MLDGAVAGLDGTGRAALAGELDGLVETLDGMSARCVEATSFPPDIRKRAAG